MSACRAQSCPASARWPLPVAAGILTLVPEAVIEVVSKGYEAKDLEIAPAFYLSQGVKDVLVFDPTSLLALHARRDGTTRATSPLAVKLECGCSIVV